MTKATALTPVEDIACRIRNEKNIDYRAETHESVPQANLYGDYEDITLEGAFEWFNGEKVLSVSEVVGYPVDEEGNRAQEPETLDYLWSTYYPAEDTPENPGTPERDEEGGMGSAQELEKLILAHMQTITAEILDCATTPGNLVIELPDSDTKNWKIAAELTDDMEDTADAVPDLIKALKEAGYRFKGEPTDVAGEVELERL